MTHSFDDDLPTHLAELTTPAPPMPPAVVASIRARAAAQRRRTAGLAAAVVIAVGGTGAAGLAYFVATPPAAVNPASSGVTSGWLGWPRHGDWPIEPAAAAASWDAGSRQVHQQVRVLYSGAVERRVLVVVEGFVPGSGHRIAVLATGNGQIQAGAALSLHVDVAGEPARPLKALVVRITTGQRTPTAVLALAAPGTPPLQLKLPFGRPVLTVDGPTGMATAVLEGISVTTPILLHDIEAPDGRELPESVSSVPAAASAGHVGIMLVR